MFGYTIINKREYKDMLDRIASAEYRLYLANGDLDFKNKQIQALEKEICQLAFCREDSATGKNVPKE